MNSESIIAYLKSLPPNNVQRVDVIVNPGSTFRGEGNFGIINIQLKSHEFEGVKGNAVARIWKTHYWKESVNLNLNIAKGRSMTNISTGFANYSVWKEGSVETEYKKSIQSSRKESVYSSREPEVFANIQSDYQINKNSVLGIVINSYYSADDANETSLTYFEEVFDKGNDLIDMDADTKRKSLSLSANTNYRYNSAGGRDYATVDIDYLHQNNRNNSRNIMNYLDPDMNVQSNYLHFTQSAPLLANVLSLKMEYGSKFEKIADIKLGIDAYYSDILNDNVYSNWENGEYVNDRLKSNHFQIKEGTAAVFFQIDRTWKEKLNASLGARLEYTKYNGFQHTTDEQFETDYLRLLPALNLSYHPSKSHSLTYNASYRISRPQFSYLNPFMQYTSPSSYSIGNPFLLPTEYITQSLNYGLKSTYFFSLAYTFSDEIINPVQTVKENNIIENSLINLGSVKSLNSSVSTVKKYFKGKGSSNLNISYQWKKVYGVSESVDLDYSHHMIQINLQNNLTISQKHKLNFNYGGRYASPVRNSYLRLPQSVNLNAMLSKSINDFNISLYTNLVYYIYDQKFTQVWRITRENNYIHEVEYTRGENTSVGFSISYNFGKTKVKGAQNRSTSGGAVKGRVN